MSEKQKIINLIDYTKKEKKAYNAKIYQTGYHKLKFIGENVTGQRDPQQRLENVIFDFRDKTVLDLGCNEGGMLFAVEDVVKEGIGVDYNPKLINVCNRIKKSYNFSNLDFFNFDLENDNFDLLNDFVQSDKIDIIFLLSVCMWIKNWRDVLLWCSKNCSYLLFETNGNKKEQDNQVQFLKNNFIECQLINTESKDDEKQKNRKLFLCKN